MALQRTVDASLPGYDNPSQMRAAGRVRQILDAAVIDAKEKGQSRALHNQQEAVKRLAREEG